MIKTREREDTGIRWHSSVNRHAMLVPSPVGYILGKQARHHHHTRTLASIVRISMALALLTLLFIHSQPVMAYPTPPVPSSEEICGSSVLNGPSSPPVGAVTVPAGDNSALFQYQLPVNTTYWFAPGVHTMLTGLYGAYDAINPGNGDTFTGAPGAILNGEAFNYEAFGGTGENVLIEYLTVTNFNTPGGQGAVSAYTDWDIEYSTVEDTVPGSGVYLGTNDVADDNCITQNGQEGFAAYGTADISSLTGGVQNVTVDNNEISYNDTCNWEAVSSFPITPPSGCTGAGQYSGCGCSGAGKFWRTDVSYFEDNYVHNDYAVGAWWDTLDTGMTVTGNYFANEYAVAIVVEISYNGDIAGNVFVDNSWGAGPDNPGFPDSAIYINGSGSDPRVPGPYGNQFDVTGNTFIDNWGGVVLYETAERFCSSIANTSTGTCTLVNPAVATLDTCAVGAQGPVPPSKPVSAPVPPGRRTTGRGGTAQGQNFVNYLYQYPYYSDCRWKVQNVNVTGNIFSLDTANIPDCTTALYCGFNGLFSNYGVIEPYVGYAVATSATYNQGNTYSGNTYCGPWQFDAFAQGNDYTFAQWQASPYNQDPGSTLDGPLCGAGTSPPPPSQPGPVNRTVTFPFRAGR